MASKMDPDAAKKTAGKAKRASTAMAPSVSPIIEGAAAQAERSATALRSPAEKRSATRSLRGERAESGEETRPVIRATSSLPVLKKGISRLEGIQEESNTLVQNAMRKRATEIRLSKTNGDDASGAVMRRDAGRDKKVQESGRKERTTTAPRRETSWREEGAEKSVSSQKSALNPMSTLKEDKRTELETMTQKKSLRAEETPKSATKAENPEKASKLSLGFEKTPTAFKAHVESKPAREVRTAGEVGSKSVREKSTTGKSGSQSMREVRTARESESKSVREMRTAGAGESKSVREVRTEGEGRSKSMREKRTTGESGSHAMREMRTAGESGSKSVREMRTAGAGSSKSVREVRTAGARGSKSVREARTADSDESKFRLKKSAEQVKSLKWAQSSLKEERISSHKDRIQRPRGILKELLPAMPTTSALEATKTTETTEPMSTTDGSLITTTTVTSVDSRPLKRAARKKKHNKPNWATTMWQTMEKGVRRELKEHRGSTPAPELQRPPKLPSLKRKKRPAKKARRGAPTERGVLTRPKGKWTLMWDAESNRAGTTAELKRKWASLLRKAKNEAKRAHDAEPEAMKATEMDERKKVANELRERAEGIPRSDPRWLEARREFAVQKARITMERVDKHRAARKARALIIRQEQHMWRIMQRHARKTEAHLANLALELQFSKHNMKQLMPYLKKKMLRIKMPEFKKEVEHEWHAFERVMDEKDHTIQQLLERMDDMLETERIILRESNNVINERLTEINKIMGNMYENFKTASTTLIAHHNNMMAFYGEKRQNCLNEIQRTKQFYADEANANIRDAQVMALENSLEAFQKFRINYDSMKGSMYLNIKRLKQKIQNEQQKSAQIFKRLDGPMGNLARKDERYQRKAAEDEKTIEELQETVSKLELDLKAATKEREYVSNSVKVKHETVKLQHRNFVTNNRKDIATDKSQLSQLVMESNNTIEWLRTRTKKLNQIISLGQICRKYETLEEQQFQFRPTSERQMQERDEVYDFLNKMSGMDVKKLCHFWERVSRAKIIAHMLKEQKRAAKQENQNLITYLKQSLTQIPSFKPSSNFTSLVKLLHPLESEKGKLKPQLNKSSSVIVCNTLPENYSSLIVQCIPSTLIVQ